MSRPSVYVMAVSVIAAGVAGAQEPPDPYLWLEEVEGQRALEWVQTLSRETAAAFEAHPAFQAIYERNLEILNSDERIPYASFRGAWVYNFWQDAEHEKGLWRRTTLASYATAEPAWEAVLDLDALAEAEGENWVWQGATCLYPDYTRCLLNLSRGGADAVVVREYDLETKTFVPGGFFLPEAKGGASWLDENTVYVATDFGPGSLTTSGYPRIAKRWRRGTPLAEAETVFEGAAEDVGTWPGVRHTPGRVYEFVTRAVTFWTSETYLRVGDEWRRLDIPADANWLGVLRGQMLVQLKSDWDVGGSVHPQGAVLSIDVDAFLAGDRAFHTVVVPGDRSAVDDVARTENLLLVNMLENVRNVLYQYRWADGRWQRRRVEIPEYGTVGIAGTDERSDTYFVNYAGFLSPSSLWLVTNDGDAATVREIKSLPAFFDAEGLVVEQFDATSADGTRVPYFVVHREDYSPSGANPTLLYGYGGFEISMLPSYNAVTGSAWLERGGVYVLANIRGGGEFGPRWHQSALLENRQRAYDDFIAVAEDLIARRITSPRRLGIMGGSNGGLLVGVAFTQRPDLFNAVVCQVPLLDMRRYNQLLAGASWMAEYGNPDIPEQWEYIRRYSPYHNVHPDRTYPRVFFVTSTRDDRVHPGHARKMVARMTDQGHPVYYYENTEGGHAAASNNRQRAYMSALAYAYLLRQLAGETP